MNKQFQKIVTDFLNLSLWVLSFLLHPPFKADGMMSKQDEIKTFSRFNRGLLVDWKNKRLSAKESFNHLALFSRTGGGKTTSYVLPNLYTLALENCSIVITDLSWEIFDMTSAYFYSQGFKIKVLEPKSLHNSVRYNPLKYAKDSMSIDAVSEILISSSGLKGSNADSRIWSDWAKNIISIIIKVLNGTNDIRYMNLPNVRYILNNFFRLNKKNIPVINEFFKKYADDKTYNEYIWFISGNEKTIQYNDLKNQDNYST